MCFVLFLKPAQIRLLIDAMIYFKNKNQRFDVWHIGKAALNEGPEK